MPLSSVVCSPRSSPWCSVWDAASRDAFAAVPAAAPPAPFATPPVLAGTPDVATLVARVTPAVVNITTIHEVRADDSPFGFGFDPFGLGSDGRRGRGDQVYRQKALGSGFLVDAGGHVVTNAHVVEGADSVKVRLADDREFEAKVRGRDTTLDIAVLELVGRAICHQFRSARASNCGWVNTWSPSATRLGWAIRSRWGS